MSHTKPVKWGRHVGRLNIALIVSWMVVSLMDGDWSWLFIPHLLLGIGLLAFAEWAYKQNDGA